MALIVAAVIAVGTLLLVFFQSYAAGMSDAPDSGDGGAVGTLIVGLSIAALVFASHWFHFTW